MPVMDDHELLGYALDHLRGQAYRPFVHVSKTGRVIAYQATRPDRDGDLDLAAALRAALAARSQADDLQAILDFLIAKPSTNPYDGDRCVFCNSAEGHRDDCMYAATWAVAGSATPSECGCGHTRSVHRDVSPEWTGLGRECLIRGCSCARFSAVAGSVTPTGDDDGD